MRQHRQQSYATLPSSLDKIIAQEGVLCDAISEHTSRNVTIDFVRWGTDKIANRIRCARTSVPSTTALML